MPIVDIVDLENRKVGVIDLLESVFGVEVNEALIHQAVVAHRANQRAGTHKVKVRSEVAGSGAKPWRQKGTGRARVGSRSSPIWRSGGTVHGPQPRSYAQRLPQKMLLAALRSTLTAQLQESRITVVEEFKLSSHKTREFCVVLEKLQADNSVLIVDNDPDSNLQRSCSNLPKVALCSSFELNPYDVLGHKRILISAEAARKCCEELV